MTKNRPSSLEREQIGAEAIEVGYETVTNDATRKFCTTCGIKKDLSCFNKDKNKTGGRRDTCKECRAKQRKMYNETARRKEISKVENEGFHSLEAMVSGGTFDPHINEVFEAMMRPFGGVNGWAKHLFATYMAAEPGSQKRVKIHDMLMNLAQKVTSLGLAERQIEMMEERDLLKVMRQHLNDFQTSNKLPQSALPTTDEHIVEAEAWNPTQ